MSKAEMLPEPTEWSEHYWQAANDELFELQHCADCDEWVFYPRALCPNCWNDALEWKAASGRGEIYSLTVLHFSPIEEYEDEAPYAVAVIELEEGPRIMTNVVNCDPQAVEIGDEVTVTFEQRDGRAVPQFEPA